MFGTIQSCRALAALLVVVFHLGATIALGKYFSADWLARPFSFGHAGVDFFFVLSGFIIVHVHLKDFGQPQRLGNYLKKRLLRIYPVYWALFTCVFVAALPFAGLRETLPSDGWTIVKTLLLLPQDPAVVGGTGAPVLIVAWSLHYELFFYALIAAFIASRWLGTVLVATYAFMWFWQPAGDAFPYNFVQSDWMLLFAFGVIVALLNCITRELRKPLIWALAGLLIFMGNGLREVLKPPLEVGTSEHLVYGLASAFMLIGLIRAEAAGQVDFLKPRWATLLGDASYALYLIHFPLISAVCKIALALGLHGAWGSVATFFLGMIASVVASVLFHLHVEKPLLRHLNAKLPSARPVNIAAGST